MTKSEEIETLRKFAANLPKRSYLVALFKHIIPQFERDIRSDFETLPDIADIENELQRLLERLRQESVKLNAVLAQRQDLANQIADLKYREKEIKDRLQVVKNMVNNALA